MRKEILLLLTASFILARAPESLRYDPAQLLPNGAMQKIDSFLPKSRNGHRLANVGNFHPLKIHVESSGLNSLKSTNSKMYTFITTILMPSVVSHMEDTFRVPETQKTRAAVSSCHQVTPDRSIKSDLAVDLILILTAEATKEDSFVAWATPCQLHQSTLRPNVGRVNLNPFFLSHDEKLFFDQFATTLHEIYHIMGFSNNLYSYFVNRGTYTKMKLEETYVVDKRQPLPYLIVSPTVVKHAKSHFTCNSVVGVPVEDAGGSGSAGSHWEKIALGNEVMVANQVANPVLSGFTLSLLYDSGWYEINWDMEEPFFWGKGKGCNMLKGECAYNGHTCKKTGDEGCFYDYTFQATCSTDSFSNNCNFFTGTDFNKHDCREANADDFSRGLGEYFGMSSRCFAGQMVSGGYYHGNMCFKSQCTGSSIRISVGSTTVECKKNGEQLSPTGYKGYIICPDIKDFCDQLESSCSADCNTNGRCLKGNKCWCYNTYGGKDCGAAGKGGIQTSTKPAELVPPPKPTPVVPPPPTPTPACPKDCSGNGYCAQSLGKCYCYSGYEGADCSKMAGCPGNCSGNGSCYNGKCYCYSGFSGDNCATPTCPNNCYARGECSIGKCICASGYTGVDCGETERPWWSWFSQKKAQFSHKQAAGPVSKFSRIIPSSILLLVPTLLQIRGY